MICCDAGLAEAVTGDFSPFPATIIWWEPDVDSIYMESQKKKDIWRKVFFAKRPPSKREATASWQLLPARRRELVFLRRFRGAHWHLDGALGLATVAWLGAGLLLLEDALGLTAIAQLGTWLRLDS